MGYNKTILQGNLTKDVELKEIGNGKFIGKSSIAVNRKYKSADGSSKEEVMFMDLVFFGKTAEIANQYLKKGSHVLVDGRLQLNSWEDDNGQKHSKHELVVENLQMLNSLGGGNRDEDQKKPASEAKDIDPKDIPF